MITVKANARSASYDSDDLITSGSAGIPCEFVLSSDFNGLSPIAVFEGSGTARDVALMGNTCFVPHEVLATAGGYLRIGIYAANSEGTIVIPTVWAGSKMILQGTTPSEVDPSEPTPSWVAQVQEAAAEALANSEEAIEIAGGAEAAAEEARQSASAAATSATAAEQSASAASGYATSASGSASAAAQSATGAAGSASNAASSASAAAGSATAAAGSAEAAAASEAAAREVEESIPADYTDLSNDVNDLKSHTPSIVDTEETEADLYIADPQGNVLAEFVDGDIATKNFDSREILKAVTPAEAEADMYICDSSGNVIAKFQDGHIVTKNFDSGAIQLDLIMEADLNAVDLYIADSFGNVVAEFRNGEIVTKNFNSGDYVDVLTDIDTLQTDVAALQDATSGIMYRMQPYTDGVYASCKYKTASNRQFCMLIAGDCHQNADGPANLIKYLNEVDAVDCAVMLGDIVSNVFENPIDHYTQALVNAQKPVLTVLGNHDVRGATSDTELWEKYGPLYDYADLASGEAVDGKCYYYKDFSTQKIRVIVLMQYDYIYTGELCFGQNQIDWLIGVLNATPADYGVIICEHTNPSRFMTYNMDSAYTADTWRHSNYAPTVMDGDPVPDIIDAWIDGGTLTQTYAYTYDNHPSALTVGADFTARGAGEFITYLGGHWHQNVLGNVTNHDNQMDFHVQANSYSSTTWSGDIPRKIGTLSEDSFCAVSVDRDKKTVKVFQVGAHFTYDAVDRQYFKYSYGGAS